MIARDELLLRFRKIERRTIGLGNARRQIDQKAERLNEHEPARQDPEPRTGLPVDDVSERQRVADQENARQCKAVRQLIADHLRRGSQAAEERVLAVRAPPGEHDPVHAHRRDREHYENRDVDVGHLQAQRFVEQAEEGRLGAEWHDGERGKGARRGDDGSQREEERIRCARTDLLFEHQLDDVRERLQQAFWTDQIRSHPLLNHRGYLALDVHHHGRRIEQHHEDEERQGELGDEERRHT